MGAGASIEDTGDLKKEYEKVKPSLTETQKTTLEETYKKVEGKNEFLIIGKCKKAYAELGIEGADPAFLPKEKKAAAPTKAPAPEPKKVQGPAPEGVTRFSLLDLPAVVKAAVESGKTPLILDPSEDGKVDTFYTYGKGARLLDAKALSLKHRTAERVGSRRGAHAREGEELLHARRPHEAAHRAASARTPALSCAATSKFTRQLKLQLSFFFLPTWLPPRDFSRWRCLTRAECCRAWLATSSARAPWRR